MANLHGQGHLHTLHLATKYVGEYKDGKRMGKALTCMAQYVGDQDAKNGKAHTPL